METVKAKTAIHPLFIVAAGSLIIFSALGSAAIMGWLPKSGAEPTANISAVTTAATTPAVTPAAAPVAVKPTPAPQVAAHTERRPVHRAERQPTVVESTQPVFSEPPVAHSSETHEGRTVLAKANESAPPLPPRSLPPVCRDCGVIESVNEIEKDGEGSGLGAVAGGVVGAIAGKQVGGGRGRTAMSVLGAVGGAFAGNAIEKKARKVKSYDVTIRFDDGSTRTLSQSTPPAWRAGDRVRLLNGMIQPNA